MVVLGTPETAQYDWADDEEAMVDAARPGYRQVAEMLRAEIAAGKYAPGTAIPGQQALAAELGADVAVVNRAVGELELEGLVRSAGQGRRTMVVGQRRFRAVVLFPWTAVPGFTPDAAALEGAVRAAAAGDPAVSAVTVGPRDDGSQGVAVSALVVAAHGGFAGHRLAELVREGAGDGWDLAGASVIARPA